MVDQVWIQLSYLVSIILFICGLKGMGHPKKAVLGNKLSATAMLIAMLGALAEGQLLEPWLIISGLALGSLIGLGLALRVAMTEMPELVALLNGLGGGASALVATGAIWPLLVTHAITTKESVIGGLSLAIGSITLSGSVMAYLKLKGGFGSKTVRLKAHSALNAGILAILVGTICYWNFSNSLVPPIIITAISILFGYMLVAPIGGADMPVVISLLNSFSGLAAAATGFVFGNNVLIVAGTLVGASGLVLTQIMCEAMNRSLKNVLFSSFGSSSGAGIDKNRAVTKYSVEDIIMQLENAQSVVLVPGYGLAVAQAQHSLRELGDILTDRGVDVRYAIHPVAGRMPGHMNVLLAEANVDYDIQAELEEINPDFEQTDVAIIVGANDVTNPAARDDKESPIYGMPILNVDKARTCVVLKRSLSPGFAGIDNELFYNENTMMVFGDAKDTLVNLVNKGKQDLSLH